MLSKETELGMITLANSVFYDMIAASAVECRLENKLWLATDKGKMLGKEGIFSDGDFSKVLNVQSLDDNSLELEFYVIMQFGVSIKQVTGMLSDHIRERLMTQTGLAVRKITIYIAGVRSRKIARRHTKVVYNYEIDR